LEKVKAIRSRESKGGAFNLIMIWVLLGFGILFLGVAQWGYHGFNQEFEDAVMQSFAGVALVIIATVLYIMEKFEVKKK